jgi:enoyl-CoA hydratase/carnithine racemase
VGLNLRRQDKVLVIEIEGRDGNTLTLELQARLAATWAEFEDDDALLVAVLHGAGGDFSTGHDPAELRAGATTEAAEGLFPLHLHKPVIAAVEGRCHGLGLELALACDLRVMAEGARLGLPAFDLPVPYRLASVLLPRQTFSGLAFELLFTGRELTAREARDARLAAAVTPYGAALAGALELTDALFRRGGAAPAKQQLLSASGLPLPVAMAQARRVPPSA